MHLFRRSKTCGQKWSVVKATWLIVVNGLMILLRPTNVKYTLSPFKDYIKQTPPPCMVIMARKLSEPRFPNDRKSLASITLSIKARPHWPITGISECVELRTCWVLFVVLFCCFFCTYAHSPALGVSVRTLSSRGGKDCGRTKTLKAGDWA